MEYPPVNCELYGLYCELSGWPGHSVDMSSCFFAGPLEVSVERSWASFTQASCCWMRLGPEALLGTFGDRCMPLLPGYLGISEVNEKSEWQIQLYAAIGECIYGCRPLILL